MAINVAGIEEEFHFEQEGAEGQSRGLRLHSFSATFAPSCSFLCLRRRGQATEEKTHPRIPKPANDLQPDFARGQKFLLQSATGYYTEEHAEKSREHGAWSWESRQ